MTAPAGLLDIYALPRWNQAEWMPLGFRRQNDVLTLPDVAQIPDDNAGPLRIYACWIVDGAAAAIRIRPNSHPLAKDPTGSQTDGPRKRLC